MDRLFLDLGNSRYKWRKTSAGLDFNAAIYPPGDVPQAIADVLADEVGTARVVIASVRQAQFNQSLARALEARGIAFEFLAIPDPPLLPLAYRDPRTFGLDRYLNLLAAARHYGAPTLVVSAGTAVTLDWLDHHGAHAGGCIFPGQRMMHEALLAGADGVRETAEQGAVLARSTAAGVAGGVVTGWTAGVQGLIDAILAPMAHGRPAAATSPPIASSGPVTGTVDAAGEEETTGAVTILLTGGDAERLHQALSLPTVVDSLLLFKGMDIASQKQA